MAGTLADLGAFEVREVFEETDERVVLAVVVGRDGLETAVGRDAFAVPADRDVLGAVDRDAFVTGADGGVFDAVVGRSALTAAAARDDLAEIVDFVALAPRFAIGAADFARTGAFARAAVVLPRPAVLPGLVPGLAERPACEPLRTAVVRRPLARIAIGFADDRVVCDSSLSIWSTFCLSRATGECAPDPICLAAPTDFAYLDRCPACRPQCAEARIGRCRVTCNPA